MQSNHYPLYQLLTSPHQRSISVIPYGKILLEGIESFESGIRDHLKQTPATPNLEVDHTFQLPQTVTVEPGQLKIRELVEQIIRDSKKKIAKAEMKKEDNDLLNMSNLGMSLLTISDHNTSHDLIITDTDNILDDFDQPATLTNKGRRPAKLISSIQSEKLQPSHLMNFNKNKKPASQVSTSSNQEHLLDLTKRKVSDEQLKLRPSYNSNNFKVTEPYAEPTAESEYYYNSFRTISGVGVPQKKELRHSGSSMKEESRRQFDLISSKIARGTIVLENGRKTELAAGNREATNKLISSTIPTSGSGSADRNKGTETPLSIYYNRDKSPKLTPLRQSHTAKENYQLDNPTLSQNADPPLNGSASKRISRSNATSNSPGKESKSVGRSQASVTGLKADSILTPGARELLKTKPTHKTIPSKFHQEVFKLMDLKEKEYNFSDSQMSDVGTHFLGKYLKESKAIETLKLDNCKITDDGLSILLYSLFKVSLNRLYLSDNQITRLGLEKLQEFVSHKKGLQYVNIKGNPIDKACTSAFIKYFNDKGIILFV